MLRHTVLLLLCVAAALPGRAAQRMNVELTDRLLAEARSNEINWETQRPRGTKVLRVGHPLTQQALKVGEDTLRCALEALLPDAGYEVRVSYAGTVPAAVRLAFSSAARAGGAPRRALQDVEKLTFRTDAAGQVLGVGRSAAPEVLVTARRSGAHAAGASGGGGFVVVDVVLSPLVHGLPAEAQQLLPWLLACVLLVAAAMFAVPVGGLVRHPAQRFFDKRAAAAAAAAAAKRAWT